MKAGSALAAAFLFFTITVSSAITPVAALASPLGSNVRVTTTNFTTASSLGYGSTVGGAPDVFQQNEPSIAVDPTDSSRLAVGVNDVRSIPTSGDAWQGLAFSTNGGSSWSQSLVPGYPGDPGCSTTPKISPVCGDGAAGDPYLGIDASHHLFYAFLAFDRPFQSSAVAVARYDVSGVTAVYSKTVVLESGQAIGQGNFGDKDALAVDSSSSSPFKDNVYVSWTRFGGGAGRLFFSVSTNHGESYSRPIKLSEGSRVIQGGSIAISPAGTVYIAYRSFDNNPPPGTPKEDGIFLVKSTDGGRTFSKPIMVNPIRNFFQAASRDPAAFRVTSLPWVAADANGVYVGWSNLNAGSGADVEIRRTTDDGSTWESPVVPHSTASSLGTSGNGHQFMPSMVAVGGKLSVVWYDSRSEPSFNALGPVSGSGFGGTGLGMDVYYSQADTGAPGPLTFETPTRVTSESFNPNLYGSILAFAPFIGDYIFVAATPTQAFVVWGDNRDINNAGGVNSALFKGDSLPCSYPCASLDTVLVNQRALDSNVYFQVIAK